MIEKPISAITQKRLPNVRRSVEPSEEGASSGTSSGPASGALVLPDFPVEVSCGGVPGIGPPVANSIDGGEAEADVGPPQWMQRRVSTGKLTSQRGQRTS